MDIVVIMRVVTCICICATVVLCALVGLWFARVRYNSKKELLEIKLKNEESREKSEWEMKMQWEEKVSANLEVAAKEKNMDLEKKVYELWESRNNTPPIDMNRIALLHLLLSGCKESLSVENLEKEIEKVKQSYEIIKNYLQ